MRSIRKKIDGSWGALAVAASILSMGCSSEVKAPIGENRDVEPQRGGVLRTASFTNLRSLDAAVAFDTLAAAIESLIYDRLVAYGPRSTKIVPQLAETLDISDDGLRYTFTLRRGVLFHDGNELRAADVKRSIERAFHPKTPCPVASYYSDIVGHQEYRDGQAPELRGVRVEGDYVVVVELSKPSAPFIHLMTLPIVAPVCASAGKTYDREFSKKACGTGPFKLEKFEHGQIVRVVRHDGYWQKGRPYLDAVEWSLSMQSFAQRLKFEDGDLDFMRDFNATDSLLYRSSAKWKGYGEWESPMTTAGVFMNTEMPPFDNRHVRRAVSHALDRQQVVMVRKGHAVPHYKMVPEAITPSVDDYPSQKTDVSLALEEMRLAGHAFDPKTGKGGIDTEIRYMALLDSFGQQAAEVFQQHLARIGVRIKIDLVSWPTFLAKVTRRKTVAMGTAGWHADYPEPSTFFEPILTSRAIADEASQNYAFFSNSEFDDAIERAIRTTDSSERTRLYRRAEEIVAEEAPWAVTHAYRYFELWHPYVHGYRPHPVLSQHLPDAWIDREGARLARSARRGNCWQVAPGAGRCRQAPHRPRTTLALVVGDR